MGKKIRKYHLQHEMCEYMEYSYEYRTFKEISTSIEQGCAIVQTWQ